MAVSSTVLAKLQELKAAQQRERQNVTEKLPEGNSEAAAGEQSGGVGSSSQHPGVSSQQPSAEQRQAQLLGGSETTKQAVDAASASQSGSVIQLTAHELFVSRIQELGEMLQKAVPGYERLLQQIHHALAQDEEVVHVLTEEQIGVVCAGLAKRKNVVLVQAKSASKTESKRLSTISVDEI